MSEPVAKHEEPSEGTGGHYWWCPCFSHNYYCPYANGRAFDGNVYNWSPFQVNPQAFQLPNVPKMSPDFGQKRQKLQTSAERNGKKVAKNSNEFKIERLFSCRLCNDFIATKDESIIRQHIEQHLGNARPFVCQICGKVFKFRSNCRNHIMAHSVIRKHIHRIQVTPFQSKEENLN